MRLTHRRRAHARTTIRSVPRYTIERLESRLLLDAVMWTGVTNNSWAVGTNWSPHAPGPLDDVTIPIAASPTILVTGTQTIQSLVSGQPMSIESGGTLAIATTAQISANMTLNRGTIGGATITATGGASLVLTTSASGQFPDTGGTLNGVTIAPGTLIDGTGFNVSARVINGLTLNGTAQLGAVSGGNFGRLLFQGTQTVSGTGSIVFGNQGTNSIIGLSSATALTIGSGITIHGPSGNIWDTNSGNCAVINNGTIQADGPGVLDLQLFGTSSLTNNGTLSAVGGGTLNVRNLIGNVNTATVSGSGSQLTLSGNYILNVGLIVPAGTTATLNGTWSNTGTINVAGATLNLGGPFTLATLGTLVRSGGTVNITGTLSGGLSLDATTGSWTLNGGTISGGTIAATGGAVLTVAVGTGTWPSVSGGVLDGVTIAAGTVLDLNGGGGGLGGMGLKVVNGLTFNGTALLGGSSYGRMYFDGTQTLGGSGSIMSVSGGINNILGGTGTLTIGSGVTIHGNGGQLAMVGTGDIVNQGTIAADGPGDWYVQPGGSGKFVTNNGSISASNGGGLRLYSLINPVGHSVAVSGSGAAYFYVTLDNAGSITATNGALNLNATLTNTGTISATNSTVNLNMNGTFTQAGLGTFNRTGGTVNIIGGGTLTGGLNLNATTGSWTLNGGTIGGGTVSATGGAQLFAGLNGGTLDGVTLNADLTVMAQNSAAVSVLNGLTLNSNLSLDSTAGVARVYFGGTQTLVGTGTVVFNGTTSGGEVRQSPAGALTIGSGVTIRTGTQGGTLGINSTGGFDIINQGTISAETSGKTLTVAGGSVGSSGTIQATAGTLTLTNLSSNTGTIAVNNATLNLAGAFSQPGGTLSRTGGTINITGTLTGGLNLDATTGSWTLNGGTIDGGTVTMTGGAALLGSSSGTLSNVAITGEVLLNTSGATVLLTGTTSFTAARLSANGARVQMAPGYVLNSLIVAEGATAGQRTIQLSATGAGTATFSPSAVVRLASGCGGALSIQAVLPTTLVNGGLITAEATGQSLVLAGNTLTNNGTLQVTAGTMSVQATNWTNPGTVTGTGGILNIDGTLDATGGIGTFNTSVATVNITGTITNTGNTITLDAATGSWLLVGGTINNGSVNQTAGSSLVPASSSGTLNNVTISGDLLLNTSGATVLLTGTTSFPAARMSGGSRVQMAPGYVLNSLIVAEGATSGQRTIQLSATGAGTATFGPSAVVRLASGCGGALAIQAVLPTTLVNGGLITAEATGQLLAILAGNTLTNNGNLQVTGGTLSVQATSWTNPGTVTGTGGILSIDGTLNATGGIGTFNTSAATVNINGTITNTGNTIALDAATGSWRLAGGTINNGSVSQTAGSSLQLTSSGGTLSSVAISAGDLLLNTTSATVLLAGTTTFPAARLTAGSVNLGMAAGYTLNSLVVDEGAATGTRIIRLAVGGSGTVTFGASAVVRVAPGAGMGLTIQNSSLATLVNNGLISAEASALLMIQNSTLTNNGTLEVTAGTMSISPTTLTNFSSGTLTGGTWAIGANSTLRVAGVNVTTNAANIILDGANANFYNATTGTTSALANFNSNAGEGTLAVTGGASFDVAATLNNSGDLTIGGSSTFSVGASGVIQNSGTLLLQGTATLGGSGTVNNTGTIEKTDAGTSTVSGVTVFNNAGRFELDAGMLVLLASFQTEPGSVTTVSGQGTVSFVGAQNWGAGSRMDVIGGVNVILNTNLGTSNRPELRINNGKVDINTSQHFGPYEAISRRRRTVVITGPGQAVVKPAANIRVVTDSLNLDVPGGARFDLNDGVLIVNYAALDPSPLATILGYINSGRNGGLWNGPGLCSTSAANDVTLKRGLGAIEASALGLTTFAGEPVDSTTVIVRYTVYGDANLDGVVDVADLGWLASNWQTAGTWSGGDFNYDGTVDVADLGILASNWQASALASAAPLAGTPTTPPGAHTSVIRSSKPRSERVIDLIGPTDV